jgi:hypothetical protein
MTYADIIAHFGNVAAAAQALGFTQRAVYQWNNRGRVPELAQRRLEELTHGKLKRDADYRLLRSTKE